jgi:UDP-GlcNAc:undecaprenyl-phosphate GlcNAc-1-phosphate transferase
MTGVNDIVAGLGASPSSLTQNVVAEPAGRLAIFEGYIGVVLASFLVTLFATPLMRRLALAYGIIDRPDQDRKVHPLPVAYLGGVAVFAGIMAGVFYSVLGVRFPGLVEWHETRFANPAEVRMPVPFSILLGMTVILLVGVIDDVARISPRVKIGGQLIAAAALALDNVGVQLAAGILLPIAHAVGIPVEKTAEGVSTILLRIPIPFEVMGTSTITVDVVYWTGTAIIALSVLALCNASNLIDGLDGLLTGTTAISSLGLLVIALGMALADDGPRDAERIILCLALLGACLGFLPHNFNPATIFLGDGGSLLLGFVTCVIILMLGDTGRTSLVAAGVIVYALPIIDTTLAIVRRRMEGKPISAPDDQHLHHQLKRVLGVKGAVFVLYTIAASFAVIGAGISLIRARSVYLLALILAAYVGVTAIKIARRRILESQALARAARRGVAHPGPTQTEPPPSGSPAVSGHPGSK